MALTIGDMKAMAEQHRRLQRALEASRTDWHQLQRALEASRTDWHQLQRALDITAETVRAYRRLHDMTKRRSAHVAAAPPEVPRTEALVGIPPPGVEWPPLGRFALRVLLATITLMVIIVVYEEGKEDAPAATLAVIYGVLAAWHQLDEAIRGDL